MNANLNFLLRLGLTYGLHDREAFIEAFEKAFGDRFSSPEKAEKTGEFLLSQMESLKDELEFSRILDAFVKGKESDNTTLTSSIDKLTTQVAELQKTLEKRGKS